ncbi:MAG: proton-conducting transporter membrane subunit [Bacteroidia bacterium]|nr:proton-conducting transporter membrane subunit [Bacteroidia bacterium]
MMIVYFLLIVSLFVTFTGVLLASFLPVRLKAAIGLLTVLVNAIISSLPAVRAIGGNSTAMVMSGSFIFGDIPLRIDALSGWFILIINFTSITGAWYGTGYLKAYSERRSRLSMHWISYILVHFSMTAVCVIQNGLAFLVAWEIMTFSSFLLVIFEHHQKETLRAGINFLIQSHIGVLLLSLGFIYTSTRTGSFSFDSIRQLTEGMLPTASLGLYLCFFAGFAFKAGFVPFHSWLPYAHPAAPAHISGLMSGVIIKTGIYGILRMILLIKTDYTSLGYIILSVSVLTGIYGVMLAIVQHNIKKMLAYHSIENIGIIGIGIGLGLLGIGINSRVLVICGFAGALMHVLNHSLFKSMLFYSVGSVYQATHNLNIEKSGGLIKKMPHTAMLFLVAALAICGFPPFNGFISEIFIYLGMFRGLSTSNSGLAVPMIVSIFGFTFIGGLSMMCFSKAFGIVFLGKPRQSYAHEPVEAANSMLAPKYLVMIMIVVIGLLPVLVIPLLSESVMLFIRAGFSLSGQVFQGNQALSSVLPVHLLTMIGICSAGFILLVTLVFLVRRTITRNNPVSIGPTWGCGYTGNSEKMQYTASSFVRSYRKLAEPMFSIHQTKSPVEGLFPEKVQHETHVSDKMEEKFISLPLEKIRSVFDRFSFLQNGNTQTYVLYGVLFITFIMLIPFIIDIFRYIMSF